MRKITRTQLWLSVAMASCIALAAQHWLRAPDATKTGEPSPMQVEAEAARVLSKHRLGQLREYEFEMSSQLELEQGGGVLLDVSVAGRWELQTIAVSAERTTLASVLRVTRFSSHGKDSQSSADLAEMQRQLADPFFFTLDAQGMIVGSRAPARTTGVVEGVVRALAGYAQVRREALGQDALDTTEVDATGRYRARYERRGPERWRKTKLAYLEVLGVVGQVPSDELVPSIVKGTTDLGFAQGELASLVLDEHIVLKGRQVPTMQSRTTLTLTLASDSEAPVGPLLAALAKATPEQPLYTRVSTKLELARMREERVRNYDIEGVAQAVAQLKPDDRRTPVQLFGVARDLLRTRPEAAQEVVSMLRQHKERAPFWIDALGNAGTPEAQAALATLYQAGRLNDPYLERRVVRALSLVEQHTPATVELLKSLERHPLMGAQAKLGLGTAANHLATLEPERSVALVEHLAQGLAAARDESNRALYIKALGNSGARSVVATLDRQLNASSALVRTQAVRALRLMPEGEADQVLAAQIGADDDYKVRTAAIRAARERTPTESVGRALFEAVQNERAQLPRSELYQTLLRWSPSAPYRNEALAWARSHETDEKLRALLEAGG